MEYMTLKEAGEKWGVTPRMVNFYCAKGRIPGATKVAAAWLIPANAKRPEDNRRRRTLAPPPLYPGLLLLDNIRLDGRSAEEIAAELPDDDYRRQFYAELAYLQGDMDKALALTDNAPKDGALSLCNLHIRNTVLISNGDYSAFVDNNAKQDEMFSRYKARPQEAACIELSQAAVICYLYAVERCPEWFKNGDFSNIPAEARFYAIFAYTKYLHSCARTQRMLGVTEAALNLCVGPGFTVTQLHLMIMRAIAFTQLGQPLRAREILSQAFAMARPYRIYQPFSENMASFRGELGAVLKESFPEDYKRVLAGWDKVFAGWTDIHNRISGANIPTHLTLKEHQIGLNLCEGLSYKEIATRMGLKPSTIRNYVQVIRDKLSVSTTAEVIQRMRWI